MTKLSNRRPFEYERAVELVLAERIKRVKREAFVVTPSTIKKVVGGLGGLEDCYGGFLTKGYHAPQEDIQGMLAILNNYAERKFLTYRYNRDAVNHIVQAINLAKAITPAIIEQMNDLYQHLDNPEGSTARRLQYILVICSGHYTSDVRAKVIQKISEDYQEALRRMSEARGYSHY